MIGEDGAKLRDGEAPGELNQANKLNQAKEAVQAASQTVKETTQSIADAMDAGREAGTALDRLVRWTREAPLQALTTAFLVGMLVSRRRG